MKNLTISQDYYTYLEEDHRTWTRLTLRQTNLDRRLISIEYLKGLEKLKVDRTVVPDIAELGSKLSVLTGWSLVPVQGLIPAEEFFKLIIDKKYPVTVGIRKPHEIDFSKEPDIFHDIFGHLPLLLNEKFSNFLIAYSKIAIKYVDDEDAVEFLARFYWYTYEMGLILEAGEHKAYGGAIITSAKEIANFQDSCIPKFNFDLNHIFRTCYNPFKLQKQYFVISDFDQLSNSLDYLERKIAHFCYRGSTSTLRL
jgi:monomeric phenylalanine-4-hydroxylase